MMLLIVSFISCSAAAANISSPTGSLTIYSANGYINTRPHRFIYIDMRLTLLRIQNTVSHTVIHRQSHRVIILRMHVVNLILFENHMSELSVFAQHNSLASHRQSIHLHTRRARTYPFRMLSIFNWSMARYRRGYRNES